MPARLMYPRELFEQAGLTDGLPFGSVELSTNRLGVPPRVWIENERLYWSDSDESGRYAVKSVEPQGMLNAFVRIDTAEDVLDFTRQYGPLGLCQHGLPFTHNPNSDKSGGRGCNPIGDNPPPGSLPEPPYEEWVIDLGLADDEPLPAGEPLERWFFYANLARRLLEVAVALHHRRGIGQEHARALLDLDGDSAQLTESERVVSEAMELQPATRRRRADEKRRVEMLRKDPAWQRARLGIRLNQWLMLGDVRPQVVGKDADSLRLIMSATNFGQIGLQLTAHITGTRMLLFEMVPGQAICKGCFRSYVLERSPEQRQRKYCQDCRAKGAPNRVRQAARRARLAQRQQPAE